jgi:hypothetical protein
LYLYNRLATWNKTFVFIFRYRVLKKVIFVHYKLAGSSFIPRANTLVEDS